MITTLTKQQKDQFPIYIKKWTDIGLCTEPANRIEAEKGIIRAYHIAGLDAPKIVWCGSPLVVVKVIVQKLNKGFVNELVEDSVRNSVGKSVGESVWGSVLNSAGESVWYSVGESVWYSVEESVRNSVDSVGESVWESVLNSVGDSVGNIVFGQHDASWLSFYDYFREVCGLKKETEKLLGLIQIAQNAGWYIPYKNVCFISERHNICQLKENKIHCDGGPAIHYPDGFSVWALNGVQVPQWLAETRDTEIDPEKIFEIDNAEVRREFVRKVGKERLASKLTDKVLDEKTLVFDSPLNNKWTCQYRLLRLKYGQGIFRHALEMPNPSLPGVWHVEYVPNECTTIEQAFNFRLNRQEKDVDDINGSDYMLHGDVIIKKKNATKFKRWPLWVA